MTKYLGDKVTNDTTIIYAHSWPIGVEDPRNPNLHRMRNTKNVI